MILKTPEEIEVMAEGGRRLGEVLRRLAEETRAGVTTKHLDRLAYQLIHTSGAKPAFLHYRPAGARRAYPYSLCTSLNDVVVHGQPADYVVKDGDLVKLDLGLLYKGFYLDAALTVAVGKVGKEAERLVVTTKEALRAAISEVRIGKTLGDIGYTVEKTAKKNRCSVADGLTGHGIGRSLHEDPTVLNVGRKGEGEELQEGIVLAIEPMLVLGNSPLKQLRDESWATADGSLAAHFEHTVAVTKNGPWILTV